MNLFSVLFVFFSSSSKVRNLLRWPLLPAMTPHSRLCSVPAGMLHSPHSQKRMKTSVCLAQLWGLHNLSLPGGSPCPMPLTPACHTLSSMPDLSPSRRISLPASATSWPPCIFTSGHPNSCLPLPPFCTPNSTLPVPYTLLYFLPISLSPLPSNCQALPTISFCLLLLCPDSLCFSPGLGLPPTHVLCPTSAAKNKTN